MNSNEIAWGIIKAVVILLGIYYIGIFLLGLLGISLVVILFWLEEHWKKALIGICIGGGLVIINILIERIIWPTYIGPRLNQNKKILRGTSLFLSSCCLLMFVIFGLVSINMTRPITSADIIFLLFSFFGAPIFLYLALRKSKTSEHSKTPQNTSEIKNSNMIPEVVTEQSEIPNINSWEQVDRADQLYCYQCTKKLSLKTWDNAGRSYCDACHAKLRMAKN